MSTEAISSAIKDSAARRAPVRIVGRGTWLDAGRPVQSASPLSLSDDSGVVSYVPGDLTLTVRAGTPLSEIERVTREHEQWLPLDPYGTRDGTIGATIATASAGPLASSFGLPRDLVLGLEFVNGRGDVVRGGGKVVKNVAGFDLSRLMTGSWGTLGVITEVTLRLYGLPKVDRSFAISLNGGEKEIASLMRAVVTSPLSPYALVFVSRSTARALGLGEKPVCLVRFGGNDAVVRAQVSALAQVARPEEIEVTRWTDLRESERGSDTAIRISSLPRVFLDAGAKILCDDVTNVRTYVDPRRGALRVLAWPSGVAGPAASQEFRTDGDGSAQVVYEKLDPQLWATVSPSATSDTLSQGIRKAYDPYNILNPGILGDLA